MCGRYQIQVTWERLVAMYGLDFEPAPEGPTLPLARVPRWSVAPTQAVPVLHNGQEGRRLSAFRWGYPMPWLARQGKDPWSRPIVNAKSEEAASKKTWASALRDRRCVVPATAFYEWVQHGKQRYPVVFAPASGGLLHFAGLWDVFSRDGAPVVCVTVLTTSANQAVTPIHDRMPVLLSGPAAIDAWLSLSTPASARDALMAPAPNDVLRIAPGNTRLNRWDADGDDLLTPDWDPSAVGLRLG